MMQLLVSIRSAEEAAAALEGGASLIDVKEPSRGSLGRPDDAVVRAVVQTVAGRRPVSAALGELPQGGMKPPPEASYLAFVKWGLAGRGTDDSWQADFLWSAARIAAFDFFSSEGTKKMESGDSRRTPYEMQAVLVAYADAERAGAPPVAEVVAFACRRAWPARQHVLLLDTFDKHPLPRRPTLLDWLSVQDVCDLCERCRVAGVRVALAGSLGTEEIRRLLPAHPDWFAVRGAVCEGCDRQQSVRADRVRGLVRLLQEAD